MQPSDPFAKNSAPLLWTGRKPCPSLRTLESRSLKHPSKESTVKSPSSHLPLLFLGPSQIGPYFPMTQASWPKGYGNHWYCLAKLVLHISTHIQKCCVGSLKSAMEATFIPQNWQIQQTQAFFSPRQPIFK